MLRFASQQVKEQITQGDSLITIKDSNKRRLQESLAFMKEWSHDLLEREN